MGFALGGADGASTPAGAFLRWKFLFGPLISLIIGLQAHGRRRAGDHHRGAARGLARRHQDLDAARPQPGTERDLLVRGRAQPRRRPGLVRIAAEDIGRMPPETSTDRGRCLIDALIVWITPDRPLGPGLNRFQVRVSDDGGTWIERYGD